jgi:hypothetical protein
MLNWSENSPKAIHITELRSPRLRRRAECLLPRETPHLVCHAELSVQRERISDSLTGAHEAFGEEAR